MNYKIVKKDFSIYKQIFQPTETGTLKTFYHSCDSSHAVQAAMGDLFLLFLIVDFNFCIFILSLKCEKKKNFLDFNCKKTYFSQTRLP
jgi:hypothetical protein